MPPSPAAPTSPPGFLHGGRHSIRFRLMSLFTVAITSVLLASGVYSYLRARDDLGTQTRLAQQRLKQRMQINLQLPMWNLDMATLGEIVKSELGPSVRGITVRDANQKTVLRAGSGGDADVLPLRFPLLYQQTGADFPLGEVEVAWSDAQARTALAQQFEHRVYDILFANLAILLALWLGLRGLVFDRLQGLNAALLKLATRRESRETSLDLPAQRHDEFDAIVNSINAVMDRLNQDLRAREAAEGEAREALTNLSNAQALLVQTEKLASLGALVAGVAHELNTPIGNAVLMASSLQDSFRDFEAKVGLNGLRRADLDALCRDAADGTRLLLRNLESAAQLIGSFKQVAVDRTSSNRRHFELGPMVDEVLSTLRFKLKSVELQVQIEAGLSLDSYPGAVGQVLVNLVENALFHGIQEAAAGLLRIEGKSVSPDWLLLSVRDNGKGIALEHLHRVFDPFFTTRLGTGGSGLGLSITHNIVVQLLGGSITVHNHPEGGAQFDLLLPRVAPLSDAAPGALPPQP